MTLVNIFYDTAWFEIVLFEIVFYTLIYLLFYNNLC